MSFTMMPPEYINIKLDTNIPQINFDQMNDMAHQNNVAKNNKPVRSDPHNPLLVDIASIFTAMERGYINPRLTQAFLKNQSDWMDWALSKYAQLNQYHAQDMFGDPIRRRFTTDMDIYH